MIKHGYIANNEAPATCSACGGKCCKNSPGITSPEDWGAPDESVMRANLAAAFQTGLYCIDWWEGHPETGDYSTSGYYVRPAQKGHERQLRHAGWGGECTFLGPRGCERSFLDRPYECRAMVPRQDYNCGDGDSKRTMAIRWLPYHHILEAFMR